MVCPAQFLQDHLERNAVYVGCGLFPPVTTRFIAFLGNRECRIEFLHFPLRILGGYARSKRMRKKSYEKTCIRKRAMKNTYNVWVVVSTIFIFTSIWGRFPFWLMFFNWVETTNQNVRFYTSWHGSFSPSSKKGHSVLRPGNAPTVNDLVVSDFQQKLPGGFSTVTVTFMDCKIVDGLQVGLYIYNYIYNICVYIYIL